MQFKIAQAVGLNTDQEAALVASVNQEGNIFLACLKLTSDDAFTKGRQVLSDLEDFYVEENVSEGSLSDKLKKTFVKAKISLSATDKFSLILAVVSGKVLYFIKFGEVEIYLKREEKLSSLSSIAQPEELVSGFLNEGDRLFFATSSLVSFLGEGINSSLDLPLDEWEEETNSKLTSVASIDTGLAGVIVDSIPEVGETPEIAEAQVEEAQESAKPTFKFKLMLPNLPKINLKRFIPQGNKSRIILAGILILVLATGAALQFKKIKDQEKTKMFNTYLQIARDDFSQAQAMQTLNPDETKNKLTSAKDNLNKALALKADNTDALSLRKQINEDGDKILQQFKNADFPLFLDLDLIKKDFKADLMSLSGNNLLLLDPNTKSLVTIDISKKSNKILAGKDQLGDATLLSINGNFAYLFSSDKGVIRVDVTNQKVTTVAKKDKDLAQVSDIAGFSGNIYLLDKAQIWKYLPTSDSYSDKREYLNKDVKADFSNAKRMQIESSIYVLKASGEMLRFTKGATDAFSISGLDKGLKNPKSLFTSSDVDNVYILDSGNNRLVVLDKKGVYKAQYQGDKFVTSSDLVVDEKNKKVYLLDGSKIYSTDLK